jgi:tetratricopeptide (TPR) repeat protein
MKKKLITALIALLLIFNAGHAVFSQETEDYTYYFNLGYSKLVDGKFNQAIEIFNKTLEIEPHCSEAYLGLGIAYRQLNQLDKALEATQKSLEYNPKYYKAYYNLGLILEQQDKKTEALQAFRTFYKKVPEARNIPDLKDKIESLKTATQS